jgi:hypothetical protein
MSATAPDCAVASIYLVTGAWTQWSSCWSVGCMQQQHPPQQRRQSQVAAAVCPPPRGRAVAPPAVAHPPHSKDVRRRRRRPCRAPCWDACGRARRIARARPAAAAAAVALPCCWWRRGSGAGERLCPLRRSGLPAWRRRPDAPACRPPPWVHTRRLRHGPGSGQVAGFHPPSTAAFVCTSEHGHRGVWGAGGRPSYSRAG